MDIKHKAIVIALDYMIEDGASEDFIYNLLLKEFEGKAERNRAKKQIELALKEITNKAKLLENNSAQKPIFDTLKELGICDF